MTGDQLHTFNTEILAGREIEDTTFFTLLGAVKTIWEGKRPWRILLKRATSNTTSASDTFETAHSLPSDFGRTIPKNCLKLVSGRTVVPLKEIPFELLVEYQNMSGYFAVDLANGNYYLTGVYGQTYTHYFSYTKRSETIAADTSWVFPSDYHAGLAFDVAAMYQLGMDFDDINARQGNPNANSADMIYTAAVFWDDSMQRNAQTGVNNT